MLILTDWEHKAPRQRQPFGRPIPFGIDPSLSSDEELNIRDGVFVPYPIKDLGNFFFNNSLS